MRIIAICMLVLLAGCAQTNEYVIGGLLPLSGPGSYIGEGNQIGMHIAVAQANEQGGVNGNHIRLLIEDSQTHPQVATNAFQSFIVNEVPVVYGTFSHISLAVQPIAEENNIVLLAESGHPTIVQDNPYTFRTFFTGPEANTKLFAHMNDLELETIAVIYRNDDFGHTAYEDLADRAQSHGITVVYGEPYELRTTDFRTHIAKLEAENPDAVYVVGFGLPVAHAYNQLEELGSGATRYGFILLGQANVIEAARDSLQGHYGIEPSIDTQSEQYESLLKVYEQEYSDRPLDQETVVAYTFTQAVIEGFKQGYTTGPELQRYLLLNKHSGPLGSVKFDQHGDVTLPMEVVQIQAET